MRYILVWCEPLQIFALEGPDLSHKVFTAQELRDEFAGNPILTQWADFARANPGKECVYDMLPI